MIPQKVQDWLTAHGKGDLQECTWDELGEAWKAQRGGHYPLGAIVVDGTVCPIVATENSATNCHVALAPESPVAGAEPVGPGPGDQQRQQQ